MKGNLRFGQRKYKSFVRKCLLNKEMYFKMYRNSKEKKPLCWEQSLKRTLKNSLVLPSSLTSLLTRLTAHQPFFSLIFAKILFLQVKILQRFNDTLWNPVKFSSTATEFQFSPISLTDKIRHLDRAHASLPTCLVCSLYTRTRRSEVNIVKQIIKKGPLKRKPGSSACVAHKILFHLRDLPPW